METIKEFLDLIAARLTTGPLDEIAARHDDPFLMAMEVGAAEVFADAEEHLAFLRERRAAMAERGVVRVVPDLVATDIPEDGRFRAWVRWRHLTAEGRLEEESGSVLVLRSIPGGGLRVESAQFRRAPMQRKAAGTDGRGRETLFAQEVGAYASQARYARLVTIARTSPTLGRPEPGHRMPAPAEKPLRVTAFFERLGTLFSEGRLEEAADLWHFPSPIMIGSQIHLMRDREDYLAFVSGRREAGLARGLISISPLLAAVEIPRYGRLRVWMRWRATFVHGTMDDADGSVFYLSRSPQGVLAVEMLESIPRNMIEAARATA